MGKAKSSNEYNLRDRMYQFVEDHQKWTKKEIVKHYLDEGVPKSTIYDILRRIENNIPPERRARTDPPHCKMTKSKVKHLKTLIDHQHGVSQRGLGAKFNVHHSTICRTIKNKTSIRYHKKKKAPKRTTVQQAVSRSKCTKLATIFRQKQVIIDDESYFGLSNFELSGNAGFYSSNVDATPNEIKLKRKQKYPPKLLVWVALSPKGISKHYVVPSGQAINQDVYIKKCLKACLIPFIKTVHKNDEVVFWPDLASSHYSNKVQDYLRTKNVEYVPKVRNIANVPEIRPIEDFWSQFKRSVYANCWQAKNLKQLRTRINKCFKNIDQSLIHKYGKASFTRVDAARRNGIENL